MAQRLQSLCFLHGLRLGMSFSLPRRSKANTELTRMSTHLIRIQFQERRDKHGSHDSE